ncbi:hypothetical protein Bca52824_077553 [Brassica carinata]|uniref:Uncharacterized protein n=1 Tax=Brassica carinata TaxID=52824 RepID=A0A8X7PTT6_BRACI|nr:hypothetical protein Bca52824_077553 [Brassica carinata]
MCKRNPTIQASPRAISGHDRRRHQRTDLPFRIESYTLRTGGSGEVNHFSRRENIARAGDFRRCEDSRTFLATRGGDDCDDRYNRR